MLPCLIHEDEHLLVVNKPAGLVVHPAAGNPDGTLQNALLHHAPELALIPRGGLVHRLDKNTSGLLVVARSLQAHKFLVDLLQQRRVAGSGTEGGNNLGGATRHGPVSL